MKHHDPDRPIGKCKGCCLNGRNVCLAGLEPQVQWARHGCRIYNDAETLRRIQSTAAPTGAKAARTARRDKAQAAQDAGHRDGHVFVPARRAARAKDAARI